MPKFLRCRCLWAMPKSLRCRCLWAMPKSLGNVCVFGLCRSLPCLFLRAAFRTSACRKDCACPWVPEASEPALAGRIALALGCRRRQNLLLPGGLRLTEGCRRRQNLLLPADCVYPWVPKASEPALALVCRRLSEPALAGGFQQHGENERSEAAKNHAHGPGSDQLICPVNVCRIKQKCHDPEGNSKHDA